MRIRETVHVPLTSGEVLRGDLSYADARGDGVIVFVHGFGSNRHGEKSVALEEACAEYGWAFAAFDFRGHGESDGSMRDLRASRLLEDLDAIHRALASRGMHRLFLAGSSMGALASAWFALQCNDVAACVLIAPAFRFLERRWQTLSDFEREYWRQAGHVRYTNEFIDVEIGYGLVAEWPLYRFEQLAERWQKPALIFHGLADDIVPASDSIEFQQKAAGADIELRLFKSGTHRLSELKHEMAAEAIRFFSRVAAQNPAVVGCPRA
jgi:pimeloyl-ACP methyl ester carboxylesterase